MLSDLQLVHNSSATKATAEAEDGWELLVSEEFIVIAMGYLETDKNFDSFLTKTVSN